MIESAELIAFQMVSSKGINEALKSIRTSIKFQKEIIIEYDCLRNTKYLILLNEVKREIFKLKREWKKK